ncbi:hybrid sensor histidine kinase/response regulator [Pedobacter antarcticus]|uniref:hybrid sensor histidine kinase/response regulator n=1 Tax=Pedobacter antarcticus TaxID=34086 RepID=UPI002930AD84|nr:ATP-binding protein [Pedobacter antarcticus]
MPNKLPLSNWSLKKTLQLISDPIKHARITVFYYIFLFNYLKIGIVLPVLITQSNIPGMLFCAAGFLCTTIIIKLLLSRPAYLDNLINFALISSLLTIYGSLFLLDNRLNVILLQDVFMICIWSFYGLKGWWGLIYSSLAAIPVILYSYNANHIQVNVSSADMPLYSQLPTIILNFIIIFMAHYYYRHIMYSNMDRQRELNAELEVYNQELKKSNQARTLFFSTVSHELRNPLNTVIGMAGLIKSQNKDADQQENLDILKFSAESLLSLINDILDFNKIGSGSIELEEIPFNLAQLMESSCAGLRREAQRKELFLNLIIPEEFRKQEIQGDPTRLLQIVSNLVSNAIKFTIKGGIDVSVIKLRSSDKDALLQFKIKDSGLGISPDRQQSIFDPYIQESNTTTRQFGGTGLGLAIVKRLLELHHSKINLVSDIESGSEFTFEILYTYATRLKQPVNLPLDFLQENLSLHKVLLAEDNAMNVLWMKKLFSTWNIPIYIAENGLEAVNLHLINDFTFILMDIQMPVMDGFTAAVKIRELKNRRKAEVPIIALTGSVDAELTRLVKENQMNGILGKPFQKDDLYAELVKYKPAPETTTSVLRLS